MKEMIFLLRDSEIDAKYAYVFRNLRLSQMRSGNIVSLMRLQWLKE